MSLWWENFRTLMPWPLKVTAAQTPLRCSCCSGGGKREKRSKSDLRGAWSRLQISHGWIQLHFLIKKKEHLLHSLIGSSLQSGQSLTLLHTLLISMHSPLRHLNFSGPLHWVTAGRSRRKKNKLIQHLDVRVRIKTWNQGVQASCGCAMM